MTRQFFKKARKSIHTNPDTGEEYVLSPSRYAHKKSMAECCQGHWHHSGEEAYYCDKLQVFVLTKQIRSYRTQVWFEFRIDGIYITRHKVDFVVTNLNGSEEVHEYKGIRNQLWIIEKRLFKVCYPDIPYLTKTWRDLT